MKDQALHIQEFQLVVMAEDFERSFDLFPADDTAAMGGGWNYNSSLDTSMEEDNFEFSATKADLEEETNRIDGDRIKRISFNTQNVASSSAKPNDDVSVRVTMHEQLSAMYDDFSQEGAISVTGSIHIKPSREINSPFCLIIKEASGNVQKIEHNESCCQDISEKAYDNGVYQSDRVLRIQLNPKVEDEDEILVASYSCVTKLRPVPLVSFTFRHVVVFLGLHL